MHEELDYAFLYEYIEREIRRLRTIIKTTQENAVKRREAITRIDKSGDADVLWLERKEAVNALMSHNEVLAHVTPKWAKLWQEKRKLEGILGKEFTYPEDNYDKENEVKQGD